MAEQNELEFIEYRIKLLEGAMDAIDMTIVGGGEKYSEVESAGGDGSNFWAAMYLSQVYAIGVGHEMDELIAQRDKILEAKSEHRKKSTMKTENDSEFPGVDFYGIYVIGLDKDSGYYALEAEESGLEAVYKAGFEAGKSSLGM